jgi:hypothetical protein
MSLTRRQFVQRAAAAGAALAVPTIITRPLWGAASPNGRVQVAQIGCGGIGSGYHIPTLSAMPDVQIVAVADAYKSRREGAAAHLSARYGQKNVTKAYADFREILARPDIDAVVIGAHDHWHIPMAIAAARAGKDVYCQKPLGINFSLAPLLRKVIHETKRVFQFGTQYRSMGRYRLMVELVRNGYIGQLKHIDVWSRDVSFNVGQYHVKPYGSAEPAAVPADLDFDAWMGPSPMVPYTVDRATNWGGYHCPETSLGFLAGCAIHELGIAQWGNKSDHTSPVHYQGTGLVPNEGIFRTLARWDMTCRYENGVTLRLMDHRTAREAVGPKLSHWNDGDGTIFYGSEGWIGDAMGFCASNAKLWKTKFKPSDERLPVSPEHNRNFIDCVKSRKETMCPVEMAIRADTICHLTNAAARTGRAIRWDPKTEQIIGDAEAAKLLTRDVREKWKVW